MKGKIFLQTFDDASKGQRNEFLASWSYTNILHGHSTQCNLF